MSLLLPDEPFPHESLTPIPILTPQTSSIWEGFHFSFNLESGILRLQDLKAESKRLPDLQPDLFHLALDDVPLPDLSRPTSVSGSDVTFQDAIDGVAHPAGEDANENIWVLPEVIKQRERSFLYSWDAFLNPTQQQSACRWLSEVQPHLFNRVLDTSSPKITSHLLRIDATLHACLDLVMGRGSALFKWDFTLDSFVQAEDNLATVGLSPTLTKACFDQFKIIGSTTRTLVQQMAALDARPLRLSETHIAVLAALRTLLHAAHEAMEAQRGEIESLIQLRQVVDRLSDVLQVIKVLASDIVTLPDGYSVVSSLMQHVSSGALSLPGLEATIQRICSRAVEPLLAQLNSGIGLLPAFKVNLTTPLTDNEKFQQFWKHILSQETFGILLETQSTLQLLQTEAVRPRIFQYPSSATIVLRHDLTAVCDIQARSTQYERNVRELVLEKEPMENTDTQQDPGTGAAQPSESHPQASSSAFHLEVDIFKSDSALPRNGPQDELGQDVARYMLGIRDLQSPFRLDPHSALSMSITPLLTAQHRLLSFSVLRHLFQRYDLLSHLDLQRKFHLFSHAYFGTRLSTALFDVEQSSGEGRRHTGLATGLRLQKRDTWPPATSELRLVLMGILSESLESSKNKTLEDTISFAVRDMPMEELERCRDVDSIYALDFLRLSYKPPNEILETIFTPGIMEKYDRLFLHLLRLLRLSNVTQHLLLGNFNHITNSLRDPHQHKLIREMHHFISTLADYTHNVAIAGSWHRFDDTLAKIRHYIDKNDYERTLQTAKSKDFLRAMHERTLDGILAGLLLKKKQNEGIMLLDGIFNLILHYAGTRRRVSSSAENGDSRDNEDTQSRFHDEFRSKVRQFIAFVQGQAQNAELNTFLHDDFLDRDGRSEGINLYEYLATRLDMFGYWSRNSKTW